MNTNTTYNVTTGTNGTQIDGREWSDSQLPKGVTHVVVSSCPTMDRVSIVSNHRSERAAERAMARLDRRNRNMHWHHAVAAVTRH